MAFGFGKKWAKRVSGVSSAQRKLSKSLGVPLSREGRRRKFGGLFSGLFGGGRAARAESSSAILQTRCPECDTKRNFRPHSMGTIVRCQACGVKYSLPERPARKKNSALVTMGCAVVLVPVFAGIILFSLLMLFTHFSR